MAAHQRLRSSVGPDTSSKPASKRTVQRESQEASRVSAQPSTTVKKPWWKRFFRSCVSSSNPDPEEENSRPADLTNAEMDEIDAKRRKRASYVPRHAGTDFSKTTTPLSPKDIQKAKRATLTYQQTQSDAEMKKAQKRATLIYQQGSVKIPSRTKNGSDSESSSVKSPSAKSPPASPPIGLSFEQPAAGHF